MLKIHTDYVEINGYLQSMKHAFKVLRKLAVKKFSRITIQDDCDKETETLRRDLYIEK